MQGYSKNDIQEAIGETMIFHHIEDRGPALIGKRIILLGFSSVWAVYFICMFDSPLSEFTSGPRANNEFNMALLGVLSIVLVLGGLYLHFRGRGFSEKMRARFVIAATISLVLGFVLETTVSFAGIDTGALYILSGTLSGFGLALLMIFLMNRLAFETGSLYRQYIPLSFVGGSLISLLTLSIPSSIAIAIVLALACLSGYCALRSDPTVKVLHALGSESIPIEVDIDNKSNMIRYAFCVVMLSLIYALIGQIALSAPAGYSFTTKLTVLVIGASGLLAYIIESIFQDYLDLKSTYKVVFAVIATGLLFLPFLGEHYWVVFNMIVVLSFYLFFIRLILLIPMAYANNRVQGVAAFASVAGLTFGVSLIGVLVGAIFSEAGGFSLVALLSIAFGSVYLISMGLLPLVKRNRRIATIDIDDADWDETKLYVQRDMETLHSNVERSIEKPLWSLSKGELGELCDLFGKHYKLTKREREVLSLVLGGRTSTEISDILILSHSTIKGHTRTLYRKCDVHSKSELLSMFERDRIILNL